MPHLRCGDSICSSLTLNILVQLFWEEAEKAKALLSTMPNFEAAVRKFIGGVVAQTYQLVEKAELESVLNLKGAALDAVCSEKGWKVQGSDVRIPVGEFNHASSKDLSNPVTFADHIAPIVVSGYGL